MIGIVTVVLLQITYPPISIDRQLEIILEKLEVLKDESK